MSTLAHSSWYPEPAMFVLYDKWAANIFRIIALLQKVKEGTRNAIPLSVVLRCPHILLVLRRAVVSSGSGTRQRHSQVRAGGRLGTSSWHCQPWEPEFLGKEPSLTQTHGGAWAFTRLRLASIENHKEKTNATTPCSQAPSLCRALTSERKSGQSSTKTPLSAPNSPSAFCSGEPT